MGHSRFFIFTPKKSLMKPLLTVERLTLSIKKEILCNPFSIEFKPGEIWGILGENGSGKTTLLQTLANLKPAPKRTIFLKEKDITHYRPKEIAKHLGILLQDTTFTFPQTVLDYCLAARFP